MAKMAHEGRSPHRDESVLPASMETCQYKKLVAVEDLLRKHDFRTLIVKRVKLRLESHSYARGYFAQDAALPPYISVRDGSRFVAEIFVDPAGGYAITANRPWLFGTIRLGEDVSADEVASRLLLVVRGRP